MQEQKVELTYDQSAPPPHTLAVEDYQPHYSLHQLMGKKLPSEGLVIRYDPENQYIAVGTRNGERILYSVAEKKIQQKVSSINENSVTSLKWRPMVNTTHKTLVTADSEGGLDYWHVPSMKKLFYMREQNNTINTLDFSRCGTLFATAGKDANIRVYDEETKSISKFMKRADWNHVGHDNRVFAVKFIDEKTLISGGWDSVIHVWDLRLEKSVKHFYGANISGESLDFQDGKILAGCYSVKDQVQVWDFNKGSKIQTIDWTGNVDIAAYVYAAAYSKYDIGVIGAGSTGASSSVKIFKDLKNNGEHALLNEIKGVNEGCFSIDFSHNSSQFAFTTAHHGIYIYKMERK